MRDRVLLECVIDVSSRRPRVAYMRDVTGLGLALAMHGAGGVGDEGPGADGPLPDAFDDGLVEVPVLGETPVDGFGLPDSFDPVVTAPTGTSATEAPSEGGEAQSRPVGRIGRWTGGEGAP